MRNRYEERLPGPPWIRDEGRSSLDHLDGMGTEFPRIDDRLVGRQHRYLTVAGVSGRHELVRGEHDRLIRYDMQTGKSRCVRL